MKYVHVGIKTSNGQKRGCYIPIEKDTEFSIIGQDLGKSLEGALIYSVEIVNERDFDKFRSSVYSFRNWVAIPKTL